ncbi:RNA recognition motif domain-containing protein [Pleurocapsa sp. FMAR1]|uniref:RNA recognition motif domain-containing protein n=1 Tax=Pleurocapsa sp. FMAR1 TaxID=3040204 RepID=UPI0029C8FC3B|nr:RNA-binding protein [Pleurocapsa sp. FMAR1]
MSIRLYVGNLPKEEIDREALATMFAESEQITTKVIKDRKTGKCRGFAFVTVESDEAADQFIEKYNGQSFMDNPLKIEKALPRSKGDEEGAPVAEGNANNAPKPKVNNANASNNTKRSGKKSSSSSSSQKQQGSIQPDPRWADELAKLKEMLASANN